MNEKTFDELLPQFGHTIQLAGVIYGDADRLFLTLMPDEPFEDRNVIWFEDIDQEMWKKIIRQTDLMETEVLAKASDGKLAKIIIRKSTRQIEQGISWAVFRRDGYRCRYCANSEVPLTVDHVVLWEDGGPSIEENLVACCRKCNKTRGRTPYEEWLNSSYYRKVMRKLSNREQLLNRALVAKLPDIPIRHHTRGR